MTTWFWTYIVPVAFVSTVAALIFLVVQSALQHMQLRLRLSAVLVVAALFVLPLPYVMHLLPQPQTVALQQQYEHMEPIVRMVTTPVGTSVEIEHTAQAQAEPVLLQPVTVPSLYEILPFVWLTGALLVLFICVCQYAKFAYTMRKSSKQLPLDTARKLFRKYGCNAKDNVILCVTDIFETPISFGFFHPCIYIPTAMLKNAGLSYALRHECMHISHHHIIYKLLLQMACVLQWFNPLAWIIQKQVAKACEYACDELVTAQMDEIQRHAYGTVLLSCATPLHVPYTANAFGGAAKQMYLRLQAVLTPQKRGAKQRALLLLAVILVLVAGSFAACAAKDVTQGLAQTQLDVQSDAEDTHLRASGSAVIPKIVGKTEADAVKELTALAIPYAIHYVRIDDEKHAGMVTATAPNEAEILEAKKGKTHVVLEVTYVGKIPENVDENAYAVIQSVPNVVGKTKEEAISVLEENGLAYEIVYVTNMSDTAKGSVISTSPAAGESVQMDTIGTAKQELYPNKVQLSIAKNATEGATTADAMLEPVATNTFPLQSYTVISTRFDEHGHSGTDIAAQKGETIRASVAGLITEAAMHKTYGYTVVIDMGNGKKLRYAHCDTILVEVGEVVTSDQIVGTVGSTGNSTGTHLHIETSIDGTVYDPAELFPELRKK